jgi:hypothetical protein
MKPELKKQLNDLIEQERSIILEEVDGKRRTFDYLQAEDYDIDMWDINTEFWVISEDVEPTIVEFYGLDIDSVVDNVIKLKVIN